MVTRLKFASICILVIFVLSTESNPLDNKSVSNDKEDKEGSIIIGDENSEEKRMDVNQENKTEESNSEQNVVDGSSIPRRFQEEFENMYSVCGSDFSCSEKKLVRLVDFIDGQKSISVMSGVVTVEKTQNSDERNEKSGESSDLFSRIGRYLEGHSIRIQLPDDDLSDFIGKTLQDETEGITTISEHIGEGRTKVRRLIIPLVLLLKLKLAILLPIFISAIALISFKGLWAGLAAMLVSGALGLRQLFANNNDNSPSTRFTLGVVKPHVVPEVYHDYWNRAGSVDHPYRGYYSWDRP